MLQTPHIINEKSSAYLPFYKQPSMESFPQEDGGQFYQDLGALKLSPTSGGLSQMGI